jgi:predicted RNA binding protein YcfA (HicA-like mRNA interferase family)
MKLPRDLSGSELAKKLNLYGYRTTRQTGSHIRLTTTQDGEHHITLPNHSSLRVGTLAAILADIASHFEITKEELITKLFEN